MISNFLDVAHLPAAASFYSNVLQPLNLRNLSTDKDPKDPSTTSVTYGGSKEPSAFFQLKKASRPKLSTFTLSAPSADVVSQVHQLALRAYPDLVKAPSSTQFLRLGKTPTTETRTRITDLDGNIMEVVYMPPSHYPPGYSGSTVRKTECTTDEVSRILNWNYDVAASDARTTVSRRSDAPSSTVGSRTAVMRRSTAPGSSFTPGATATATRPVQNSGISTTTVIGTLVGAAVGVAAGAAITYGVMTRNNGQQPDSQTQPGVPRRTTMPETGHVTGEVESCAPARSIVSRAVDDMGYDIEDRLSGFTITDKRYPPSAAGTRVSTRSRARSTSETGGQRRPLLLTDMEHNRSAYAPSGVGSAAPSRYTATGKRAPTVYSNATTEYKDERPLMANIPLDPTMYPASKFEKAPSVYSKAPSRAPTEYKDERPLMANIPLDPTMYPASKFEKAPSVYSKAPSRAPTEYQDERPLMANIPLDPTMYPASSIGKAPSVYSKAPSRAPTEYKDERPLMANIPLDPTMYPASKFEKAPSVYSKAPSKAPTKTPSLFSRGPSEFQDERPLMANIPLDPSMYPAEQASFKAPSKAPSTYQDERPLMANIPLDDTFSRRGSGDEPAYVLDGRESNVSRQTTRPPVMGGGASVAGARSKASAPRWESQSVYDTGKGSGYKAGSRVATTDVQIPHGSGRSVVVNKERRGRSRSRGRSQAGTYMSARKAPIPDDLESLGPNDSISCVASRH